MKLPLHSYDATFTFSSPPITFTTVRSMEREMVCRLFSDTYPPLPQQWIAVL